MSELIPWFLIGVIVGAVHGYAFYRLGFSAAIAQTKGVGRG